MPDPGRGSRVAGWQEGRMKVNRLQMRSKHPLAIRWCHWVNFPLLALMIWSGLWIYWANDVYRIGLGSHTLFNFFPKGFYSALGVEGHLAEGMAWHFYLMWFFAVNGVVYVAYTLFSGEWRYLVPNRQSFREAIRVFRLAGYGPRHLQACAIGLAHELARRLHGGAL
jgi:thiosulfate reductase cytochrome b subunit